MNSCANRVHSNVEDQSEEKKTGCIWLLCTSVVICDTFRFLKGYYHCIGIVLALCLEYLPPDQMYKYNISIKYIASSGHNVPLKEVASIYLKGCPFVSYGHRHIYYDRKHMVTVASSIRKAMCVLHMQLYILAVFHSRFTYVTCTCNVPIQRC